MEASFDTFDFTRISEDTIPTAISQGSKNQYSDHSIFRAEGAHWRCGNCVESVIYSLASGHGQHVRMWKCCQCGFAENRVSLWAACSMCDYSNFLEKYAFQPSSKFQLGIESTIEREETFETSHVICADVPAMRSSGGAFATDDFVSAIRQNLASFEHFLHSGGLEDDVMLDDLNGINELTFMSSMGCGSFVADTVDMNVRSNVEVMTTLPSEESTSTASTTTTSLAKSNLTAKTLRDLDSGYGSQCTTSEADRSSLKRPTEYDHRTTPTAATDHDYPEPPPSKKPRRRRLDPLNPGLACPFYKRNPHRCKHDSCAGPGFLGIHRLKQHLERVHLYHTCSRCGATFRGNTAGRDDLAAHQRNIQPCQLLVNPKPEIWGISHATFEAMRTKKKGAAGKSEQERWRGIYRLVFPDADKEEMAMPYVDAAHTIPRYHDQKAVSTQNQLVDNSFSREILRVLPARLNAAVRSRCNDSRLAAMWSRFSNAHLHDVLRDMLGEVVSAADKRAFIELGFVDVDGG